MIVAVVWNNPSLQWTSIEWDVHPRRNLFLFVSCQGPRFIESIARSTALIFKQSHWSCWAVMDLGNVVVDAACGISQIPKAPIDLLVGIGRSLRVTLCPRLFQKGLLTKMEEQNNEIQQVASLPIDALLFLHSLQSKWNWMQTRRLHSHCCHCFVRCSPRKRTGPWHKIPLQ